MTGGRKPHRVGSVWSRHCVWGRWKLVRGGGWHHTNQRGLPEKLVFSPKNRLQGENEYVQWLLRKRKRLGEAVQVGQSGQSEGPSEAGLRAQMGGGVAEEVSVREEAVGGLFSGRD